LTSNDVRAFERIFNLPLSALLTANMNRTEQGAHPQIQY
jgi:hypothetical protein